MIHHFHKNFLLFGQAVLVWCCLAHCLTAQPQQTIPPLFHGSRQIPIVALTFDACPSSTNGGFNKQIVQTLIDSNISATFFLSGRWVEKHSADARWLAAQSLFELGNHSYSHPHMTNLSRAVMKEELRKTQKIIFQTTGIRPAVFRPPYVELDASLCAIADSLGLRVVMYDLASGDPDTTITARALIRYVPSAAKNGSIIVMHVNGRGWHTAEALPAIIAGLKKRGFTFVKISDMPIP